MRDRPDSQGSAQGQAGDNHSVPDSSDILCDYTLNKDRQLQKKTNSHDKSLVPTITPAIGGHDFVIECNTIYYDSVKAATPIYVANHKTLQLDKDTFLKDREGSIGGGDIQNWLRKKTMLRYKLL